VIGRLNEELDEDILVDTGARSNVIRVDVVKKLNAFTQIVPTDICLTAASTSIKRYIVSKSSVRIHLYKLLNQGLRQKTGGIYSKYASKILAKSNMLYLLSRW
jgi:hypothetical protein